MLICFTLPLFVDMGWSVDSPYFRWVDIPQVKGSDSWQLVRTALAPAPLKPDSPVYARTVSRLGDPNFYMKGDGVEVDLIAEPPYYWIPYLLKEFPIVFKVLVNDEVTCLQTGNPIRLTLALEQMKCKLGDRIEFQVWNAAGPLIQLKVSGNIKITSRNQ